MVVTQLFHFTVQINLVVVSSTFDRTSVVNIPYISLYKESLVFPTSQVKCSFSFLFCFPLFLFHLVLYAVTSFIIFRKVDVVNIFDWIPCTKGECEKEKRN